MPDKTSAAALRRGERDRQAYELRLAGATTVEVARALGFRNPGRVTEAVNRHRRRCGESPHASEVRQTNMERCERLIQAHWRTAMTGSPTARNRATDRIVALMDMENNLAGSYAPRELAAHVDTIDDVLARIAEHKAVIATAGLTVPDHLPPDWNGGAS